MRKSELALADGLTPLAGVLRGLRIVGGIGIVLGYSRDEPATGDGLQVCLQRVSNLLGVDLPVIHVERKGFQIFLLLCRIFDRRLRPLVERTVFDAVLFCCGDILRKGIELAFRRSAMLGEDIEQRRQCRITDFLAYRFRGSRIVHIESDLIQPLRSHAILAFWSRPTCPFRPQGATAHLRAGPARGDGDAIMADGDSAGHRSVFILIASYTAKPTNCCKSQLWVIRGIFGPFAACLLVLQQRRNSRHRSTAAQGQQLTCASHLKQRRPPTEAAFNLMDTLTLFGLFAVTAMLICYAVEDRSPWFILAFAGACALGSLYGFLQGAWPFGLVEAIWSIVALRRWHNQIRTPSKPTWDTEA
jgi:hypothetical protein